MYNFYQPGRDYFPAPNQPTYSTGPKLLDPSPSPPQYAQQPPRIPPRMPGQMPGRPGYSPFPSLGPVAGAPQVPGIPEGFEKYRIDQWGGSQIRPPKYWQHMGWKRIKFGGQDYWLPPGMAPPPGYQEPRPPQYTVRV